MPSGLMSNNKLSLFDFHGCWSNFMLPQMEESKIENYLRSVASGEPNITIVEQVIRVIII